MSSVNIMDYDKKVAGPFESHDAAEDWLVENGYKRFEGSNICWRKGNQFVDITPA
jgi:hypothetical protein